MVSDETKPESPPADRETAEISSDELFREVDKFRPDQAINQ